jgi:hypothetical protein
VNIWKPLNNRVWITNTLNSGPGHYAGLLQLLDIGDKHVRHEHL